MNGLEQTVKACRLDNGALTTYDIASHEKLKDSKLWDVDYLYIGYGVVESVDGVKQNTEKEFYFYDRC